VLSICTWVRHCVFSLKMKSQPCYNR